MAWHKVAALAELPEGEMIEVKVGDTPIALYHVEGTVYATSNICTHAHACLHEGFLEGHKIECPLHQQLFDVRSGEALEGPAEEDLPVYPVKVEDGAILVEV